MFTTAVKGSAALRWVGGTPGNLDKVSEMQIYQEGGGILQPVKFSIVCELEDEFVNHAIDANCPADEFEVSIGGVVEDEAVSIKG